MKKIAKRLIVWAAVTVFALSLTGCGQKEVTWNGKTEVYADMLMTVDCSDLEEYCNAVTNVFVGTVTGVERNVLPSKPKEHEDNYSVFDIQVDRNLKGSLEGTVICRKLGGLKKDGTMLLVMAETPSGEMIMDTGLPEEGKQYIFLAYMQPDGRLILSEIFDNREYSDDLLAEYTAYLSPVIVSEGSPTGILKLGRFPLLSEELETEPGQAVSIDLPYSDIPEVKEQYYSEDCGAGVFADYVRDVLGVELDARWKVFIHYYDEARTVGMVEFLYTIGEIDTNKSIIFNLNSGKADTVYCKYLDCEADEEDLLRRVRAFQEKYEQEKKQLAEGEVFESETVDFTYYYNNEKLVYCYNLFFSYGEGIINNDYGTFCFIDSEGNAVHD